MINQLPAILFTSLGEDSSALEITTWRWVTNRILRFATTNEREIFDDSRKCNRNSTSAWGGNGVRPITKSILFTSLSKSVLSLNFFVIYNSGTMNPLTPGAFCKKGVSWSFWWFLGWISAKLALIWSKMHLHHDSLAFLPLASRFATFWLGHVQKSNKLLASPISAINHPYMACLYAYSFFYFFVKLKKNKLSRRMNWHIISSCVLLLIYFFYLYSQMKMVMHFSLYIFIQ